MEENAVKKQGKLKRGDNDIPDYAHLFTQTETKKGKLKNKFFSKLVKLNVWGLILSTFVYILQASPTWATPICTANIINVATDAVSKGGMTDGMWLSIIINASVMGALILLNVPITVWRWRIVSKMLRQTSAGIKSSVVRKLQSLSITYHKDMQTGKIQSKFLKDTDSVDMLFHMLMFSIIPSLIGAIGAISISIYKNGLVSLFFLMVIPVNVALTCAFRKKIKSRYRDYRLKTESMSNRLSTMLSMMMVTKSHGLETKEIDSVESSIKNLAGSGRMVDKTLSHFGAWSWVVSAFLSATCLVFCSILAIKRIIGIGDIVLYQSMFSSISAYVTSLIGLIPQLGSGFEALSSVSEIMNAKDVEVNIGKKSVQKIDGAVRFDGVYYKYPSTENYVVQDLSLDVKAGECIAVVGSSGSGKSTLMNLIIGLLKPTSGAIFVDGKAMNDFNLSEYRHNISVVPQNSILFDGSIKDNITYGLDKYSQAQLEKVLEMANLNEFINELPNGIDTSVGEHGDKLSGGQRQRVTIARALIRNPKILILDEATSALDNISEYHVQKAIAQSIKGRTTFIVAHRLSTIRNADRIVVMENGKAVEMGTYDELMAKKGKFFELKALNEINLKEAQENLA